MAHTVTLARSGPPPEPSQRRDDAIGGSAMVRSARPVSRRGQLSSKPTDIAVPEALGGGGGGARLGRRREASERRIFRGNWTPQLDTPKPRSFVPTGPPPVSYTHLTLPTIPLV